MNIIRRARLSDFRTIYNLQNVPFRVKVFGSPLLPFGDFFALAKQKIEAGQEHYFVLETEGEITGFVWFVRTSEFWHTTVWGKWVRTLAYVAFLTAFQALHFPRVVFGVRQDNRRMIRVCEQFGFRFAGEASTYVIIEEAPYLTTGKLNYYDIRAEEFWEKAEDMRKQSLDVRLETE